MEVFRILKGTWIYVEKSEWKSFFHNVNLHRNLKTLITLRKLNIQLKAVDQSMQKKSKKIHIYNNIVYDASFTHNH